MVDETRAASIHRELIQLTVLIVVAVAAFAVTRAVAGSNRTLTKRDAAGWYRLGNVALQERRVERAVEPFRRAAAKDPESREYALALARALGDTGQVAAARNALTLLHDSRPDDPAVNLELARLAVRQDDVEEAIRDYHNALYSPWPGGSGDAQARARLELARFLIAHGRSSQALSELLVSSTEIGDSAAAHVELGRRFAEAGDTRRALDHFQRALRLDPRNTDALAGAGEAAFARGEYAAARGFLRAAANDAPAARPLLEISDLVLSADPLAPRLASGERARRLTAALAYIRDRLGRCAAGGTLLSDIDAFTARLKPAALRETETIDAGVDLIDRLAREVIDRCPPAAPMDRALAIVGSRRGGNGR